MLASTDPVFVSCWSTGPDARLDGVWQFQACGFPEGEGRVEVVPRTWMSPYAAGPAPRNAPAELAAAGLTGAKLAEADSWEEAAPALFAQLEARPVIIASDREGFLQRFRLLCPQLEPPVVVDLESMAAFLHPRRGEPGFKALQQTYCGSADATQPSAAALRRLTEALVRAHYERSTSLRQVYSRCLDELTSATEGAGEAWEWLELLRRLLDRPSRYAAEGSPDLFFAALEDGAYSADLDDAPLDVDRALHDYEPRFLEDYRARFAAHEPLQSRLEEPATPPIEDAQLQQGFFDLLPRQFGEDQAERPGQRALGEAVAGTLGSTRFLIGDAPTGTGKTLAYLAPALLWAARNQTRVGLSTYTRALQEQAFFREVPRALRLLEQAGMPREELPRVTLLKGRANYICGRAVLDTLPEPGQGSLQVRATWLRLAMFWAEDPTADLDGFPIRSGLPTGEGARIDRAALRMVGQVRALPDCCRGKAALRCGAGVRSLRAERAHLVVTNHAYILARPEQFSHLVFDECDHLHEVALSARSYDIELDEVTQLANDLQQGRGRDAAPLPRLRRLLTQLAPGDLGDRLLLAEEEGWTYAAELDAAAHACTRELREFQDYRRETEGRLTREEAAFLLHEYLGSGRGDKLLTALHALREAVQGLDSALRTAIEELGDIALRSARKLRWSLRRPLDLLAHWHEGLDLWLGGENEEADFSEDLHFEVDFEQRRRPMLALKWLLPQKWLGEVYFPSLQDAVLVSATARIRGGFRSMKSYLGLDLLAETTMDREGREVVEFAGPATFETSAALYGVPEDAPPYAYSGPAAQEWLEYVERLMLFLAERSRGRMLGLFTSRAVLRRVGERLAPRFRALGIPFWWQGMPGLRKEEIAARFRAERDSVLFGLDTYWHGVDFPGDTCQYVIIPKLPYGAPDNYMIAQQARMGWGRQRNQIYLPKALAMFRQGCGRLLRGEKDRGAVLILDRRVLDKKHADFLKELPRGPEEWQEPEVLVADTEAVLAGVFKHMKLGAEMERRSLDPSFRSTLDFDHGRGR